MNSAVQSQPNSLSAESRRAPLALAAFALLGVVALAGIQFSHASAASSVPAAPTTHMISAIVAEPAPALSASVDWDKVAVAAESTGASVAAYER